MYAGPLRVTFNVQREEGGQLRIERQLGDMPIMVGERAGVVMMPLSIKARLTRLGTVWRWPPHRCARRSAGWPGRAPRSWWR